VERALGGAVSAVLGLTLVIPLVAASLSGWVTWPSKWYLWAAATPERVTQPILSGSGRL
jgi:hypothetical protein